MSTRVLSIDTPRLRLVPGTVRLHEAELVSRAALASLLGADVPDDWPPADGEYDRDAISFFIELLGAREGEVDGWMSFFVLAHRSPGSPPVLVANAGYFGPPDAGRSVEIGYSVSAPWRRHGYATESVEGLVSSAFARGAERVIAHVRPDNAGSIAVLARSGFAPLTTSDREHHLCFERRQRG